MEKTYGLKRNRQLSCYHIHQLKLSHFVFVFLSRFIPWILIIFNGGYGNSNDQHNVGNCNGQTSGAEPASSSCGTGVKVANSQDACWQGLQLRSCEKRVFAAPKTPVPVESRRQRAQQAGDNRVSLDLIDGPPSAIPPVPPLPPLPPDAISFPLQLTDDGHQKIDSAVQAAHSLPESEPIRFSPLPTFRRSKVISNPGGFFRQIFSEDEIVYQTPKSHLVTSEHLAVVEAVYAEASLPSVCGSSVASFGERQEDLRRGSFRFGEVCANVSTSDYADPFEHYASSLLDHNYEEMDHEEYHQLSLPFIRRIKSRDRPESGVSISSSSNSSSSRPSDTTCSSDSGANMTIPPGFARSRAALFESIAQANQQVIRPDGQNKLIQALGPQLALYSLCSLRTSSNLANKNTLSKSCPSSLNAINWVVDGCVDNDGFFMEFANQRIALPDLSDGGSSTSCSSLDSASEDTSTKTESTSRSKSIRKVSFVFDPKPTTPFHGEKMIQLGNIHYTLKKGPRSQKSSTKSFSSTSTALSLSRFFRQTFARCGGDAQPSDTESLMSHPIDDLLSQSDLEMFCESKRDDRLFDGNDSGTDMTTPDSSLYHDSSNLAVDIDKTLSILEVKAKTNLIGDDQWNEMGDDCSDSCTSCDDSDSDSSSSGSSCKSGCCLTDCTSWTSWTSEGYSSSDVIQSRNHDISSI